MKKTALFVGFMLIFTGCGPSRAEYDALLQQNSELQQSYNSLELNYQELLEENSVLEQRLDDIVINPEKLESEIKEHLTQNDHDSAYEKASILNNKFPETLEAIRTKPLFQKLQKERNEQLQNALSKIKIQKNPNGSELWYFHKDLLSIYETTELFAYIIEKDNKFTLILRAQQFAPRGSSLKKAELILNNSILTFVGKPINKSFNNKRLLYINAPIHDLRIVHDITRSNGSTINFYGSNPLSDLITPKEQIMITEVLKAYELLTKTVSK